MTAMATALRVGGCTDRPISRRVSSTWTINFLIFAFIATSQARLVRSAAPYAADHALKPKRRPVDQPAIGELACARHARLQRAPHLTCGQSTHGYSDQPVAEVGVILQLARGPAKDSRIFHVHAVRDHRR